jgi:transmembrane sensor
VGAAALAAALCVGFGLSLLPSFQPSIADQSSSPQLRLGTPDVADAALLLEGGEAFVELDLPSDAAVGAAGGRLAFEDGSSIGAKPGTRVEALAMTARDVTLRLVRGSIDVHVDVGGPRRWTIETGVLSVEVVGTKFTVERYSDRVGVRVSHGAVLVRSGELSERVERLAAGQELNIAVAAEPAALTPPDGVDTDDVNTDEVDTNELNTPRDTSPVPSVEALLQRADAARLSGDLSRAQTVLETVVRQFANDPRAGLAAYQLASVREQQGAPASEVAQAFARALTRARGGSLRQDCHWQLARAQLRAGQLSDSRKTAERALAEYPTGRYAERLERHLESIRN